MHLPARTRFARRAVVFGFFATLFAIGIAVHRDYGVPWDEPVQRRIGRVSWDYVRNNNTQLLEYRNRYYGPAYEMLLVEMERLFHPREMRDIYFLRHLANFLLFFGAVVAFYLLCRRRFRDWRVALVGCVLLCLSPRIFADAFYNSKDLSFFSFFLIAFYTMVRLLENPSWIGTMIHALASAWLIDIRVLGILIPALTVLAVGLQLVRGTAPDRLKVAARLVAYIWCTAGLVVLFWPTLWQSPLAQFGAAMALMARYHWAGPVLYLGKLIPTSQIPWHYTLVWIAITTPIVYLLGFLVGMPLFVRRILRFPLGYTRAQTFDLLVLLWILLPLAAVIVLRSVVYDAWRHVFFIYPAVLIVALYGFRAIYRTTLERVLRGKRLLQALLIGCLALNAGGVLLFMVRYHPHQNVFFNHLVGGMAGAQFRFEMDYWGLSYRQGLEHIARTDQAPRISVYFAEQAGKYNIEMLPKEDRARFFISSRPENAGYFLGSYRMAISPYPYTPEYYGVKVGGVSILSVFKMPGGRIEDNPG